MNQAAWDAACDRIAELEAVIERLIETNNSDTMYRVRAEQAEAALAERDRDYDECAQVLYDHCQSCGKPYLRARAGSDQ